MVGTMSQAIRDHLLTGEWIGYDELADKLGARKAQIYSEKSRLHTLGGAEFEERREGNFKEVRCTQTPNETYPQKQQNGRPRGSKAEDDYAKPRQIKLPEIGSVITVSGVFVTPTNQVMVTLRSNTHSWSARLEGEAPI